MAGPFEQVFFEIFFVSCQYKPPLKTVLEYPHRIGCAEYRNRACKPDAFGARCGCGQNNGGRRIQKLFPVVLSNAEYVKTRVIRMFYPFE
jgi:hypothetical protein